MKRISLNYHSLETCEQDRYINFWVDSVGDTDHFPTHSHASFVV